MKIREITPNEYAVLKDFLYEAIFIPEGVEAPSKDIVEQPELKLYYEDFGKGRGDHAIVAEEDGRIVGAVWTRIMDDYGHVDDDTPNNKGEIPTRCDCVEIFINEDGRQVIGRMYGFDRGEIGEVFR